MAVGRDQEIYPNSPLVDVVCEVRFPGEMQVECDRHLFWNRIRDRYPLILVPKAQDGQALALQHYRCQSANKRRTVSVAINSLAFSETTPYSGHTSFLKEFQALVKTFRECYPGVRTLNRVGWRYINVIPMTRANGIVPVSQYLKVSIALPRNLFDSPKTFDVRFETVDGDCRTTTRLAVISQTNQPDSEGILLDIDSGLEKPNMPFSKFGTHVQDLRARGRKLFEDLVTDNYRTYLEGKTL